MGKKLPEDQLDFGLMSLMNNLRGMRIVGKWSFLNAELLCL